VLEIELKVHELFRHKVGKAVWVDSMNSFAACIVLNLVTVDIDYYLATC
jgi:hypothetical protein